MGLECRCHRPDVKRAIEQLSNHLRLVVNLLYSGMRKITLKCGLFWWYSTPFKFRTRLAVKRSQRDLAAIDHNKHAIGNYGDFIRHSSECKWIRCQLNRFCISADAQWGP